MEKEHHTPESGFKTEPVDQRYRLLSVGERKYIQMSDEEVDKSFKRPDLTKAQYDMKIKRRVMGAIDDLNLLFEKLPKENLKKILTDEYIDELIKITAKVMEVAGWRYSVSVDEETGQVITKWKNEILGPKEILTLDNRTQKKITTPDPKEIEKWKIFDSRKTLINNLVEQLQKCIMSEYDLEALEELKEKYDSPAKLLVNVQISNYELRKCYEDKEFIESKDIREKYELWKECKVREDLRKSGWSEEKINNFYKK